MVTGKTAGHTLGDRVGVGQTSVLGLILRRVTLKSPPDAGFITRGIIGAGAEMPRE